MRRVCTVNAARRFCFIAGMKSLVMPSSSEKAPPLVALGKFLEEAGLSSITAWRWRRKGWLKTTNICGRQYLTAEAIEDFKRRAAAGEFAKEAKTPVRA